MTQTHARRRSTNTWILPLASLLMLAMSSGQAQVSGGFSESFTGGFSPQMPGPPTPWTPDEWDVQVHVRAAHKLGDAVEAHDAHHGPACEAPGHDGAVTHPVTTVSGTVYQCANHVMTSLKADDYGLIALTPPAMVDFSEGEATIRVDVSTLSVSSRDWFGLVIQPLADNLPLPVVDWLPDLNGFGRNAIHFDFDSGRICPVVYRDFIAVEGNDIYSSGCRWWDDWRGYLTPSAMTRRTLQITVSRTRVRVEVPEIDLVWADMAIADLGWSQGVVSLLHHSYTPFKDGNGGPNTWHWDNLEISPAKPLRIVRTTPRSVSSNGATFNFAAPAPAGAHLRGSAIGTRLQISFDDGASWQEARRQPSQKDDGPWQIWHPVPVGTRSVAVRAGAPSPEWWPTSEGWIAKDFSLLAPGDAGPSEPPADPQQCLQREAMYQIVDGRWKLVEFRSQRFEADACALAPP